MLDTTSKEDVFTVILKANPWWSSPENRPVIPSAVRRTEYDALIARLERNDDRRAQVLVGPRQVGKSTLLKQLVHGLMDRGVPADRITLIDCEDLERQLPALEVSLLDLVEVHEAARPPDGNLPRYYLFDEVHASRNWSSHLKKLVDRGGLKIIATDSSAAILHEGTAESGQGRWNPMAIGPWSYGDFERLLSIGVPADSPAQTTMVFERYLHLGGFPEHARQEDYAIAWHNLRKDTDASIEKDLIRKLATRKNPQLKSLFVALTAGSGSILDLSSRANDLEDVKRQTVAIWIDHLEEMGLLHSLPRHARSARKATRGHPRIYSADPALVFAFALDPDPRTSSETRAKATETVFYLHARLLAERMRWKLTYYRDEDKREADFVLEHPAGTTVMEVTSSRGADSSKIKKAAAVADLFDAKTTLVASLVQSEREHTSGTRKVFEIPLPEFTREASLSDPSENRMNRSRMKRWLGL